jgi:hypothetical protein
LWEALLDEKVTRPDRFVRELFSRGAGRTAYLYTTIDHVDPARRAFALGLWMNNPGARLERFRKFADAAIAGLADWQINVRPFDRTMYDVSMLLARVGIDNDGVPVEPRAQVFWSRVFETSDLQRTRPAGQERSRGRRYRCRVARHAMLMGDAAQRQRRFEQFTFGQRVLRGSMTAHCRTRSSASGLPAVSDADARSRAAGCPRSVDVCGRGTAGRTAE